MVLNSWGRIGKGRAVSSLQLFLVVLSLSCEIRRGAWVFILSYRSMICYSPRAGRALREGREKILRLTATTKAGYKVPIYPKIDKLARLTKCQKAFLSRVNHDLLPVCPLW